MVTEHSFHLSENSKIYFGDTKYRLAISQNHFIVCDGRSNSVIFDELTLNKVTFTESILGYCGSGSFPECKSIEDLTALVLALAEEAQKKNIAIKYERV